MDVSFNSVARSLGEKRGVRAGRSLRAAFVSAVAAALLGGVALAQTAVPPADRPAPVYTPTSLKAEPGLPRTPQGTPDFQGEVWSADFLGGLVGIPFVTPAELVITEAQSRTAHDGFVKTLASNPLTYQDPEIVYLMSEMKGFPIVRGQRRSRLLVLPADGKLPLTAEAQAEMQRTNQAFNTSMNRADNPEERMVTERCLPFASLAPYASPPAFNPIQFVQTRDHLVVHSEYSDEVRIVPFAKTRSGTILPSPMGEGIAWWEGDTLVIETMGSPLRNRVTPFGGVIVNPDARVIERLTRVSRDEIVYQFTIEDPTVYTAPWLGEFSLFRSAHNRMYGSHCHEGNYGLYNILAGARYEDRHGMTLPAWAKDVAAVTAEPAHRWRTSAATAADVRSWAIVAARNAEGLAKVALRIERAQPSGGDKPSLSELNVFEVDCVGQRLRMEALATYAGRNLTGERTAGTAGSGWSALATRPAIAAGVREACS